jgi:hypothetical protein
MKMEAVCSCKLHQASTGQHSLVFQKIVSFILTAARTLESTKLAQITAGSGSAVIQHTFLAHP